VTIDGLVMVGENLFGSAISMQHAAASATSLAIEGMIVAPGRPRAYALPPANDQLAADQDPRHDVMVWRLGRVDPRQGMDAVAEARRCLTELACVGLFLHPGEEQFALSDCQGVVGVAAAIGRPVVIAAGVPALSEPLQFLELSRAVPDASIVMTNGGHINISGLGMTDAWAAIERSPNLYLLSNGTYRQDFLQRVVRELGAHRLLFGSFAPNYVQSFELARVRNLSIDAGARARVEGDNARHLFDPAPGD
jgi:predicted TIM-barrel fold metal-dependent hydrolase